MRMRENDVTLGIPKTSYFQDVFINLWEPFCKSMGGIAVNKGNNLRHSIDVVNT